MGFLFIILAFVCLSVSAAELPPQPADVPPPSIRELHAGVWQVGAMRVDKRDQSVRFPARMNMTDGLLEYVLVHERGKDHESLLTTAVPPYHLQVAMLLLGARGADPKLLTNAPPSGPIRAAGNSPATAPPPVPGDPVSVELEWTQSDETNRRPAEALLLNKKTGRPMSAGSWTFSGSMIWEGAFIAQIEGSIMAVITDISAMFNNPRPDRDVDSLWEANTQVLPPERTPVTVIIRRIESPSAKSKDAVQ